MRELYQFQIKALSSLACPRLLNILFIVCFRRLDPRRFDFIFDLKLEYMMGCARRQRR